jgi:lysophospholipase L1-like esterase
MTTSSSSRHRGRTLAIGVAVTALATAAIVPAVAGIAGASAHSRPAPAKVVKALPVVAGSRYLALGDSISFGYREPNSIPTPNYNKTSSFVGFPEDVAANLGLKLTNAACPGETTASFLNTKAQSNGCENHPKGSTLMFRNNFPLHAKYASKTQSQMAFALAYLKKHPGTRLITLMIGANDGFLCIEQTADSCISELPTVVKKIGKNVSTILKTIRTKGHYTGQLVLVDYYSTDYPTFTATYESQQLNMALTAAAKPYHVSIADGFGQFRKAAALAKGHTCTAGLLTALTTAPAAPCGVHPSVAGQALLAQAVERAVKK